MPEFRRALIPECWPTLDGMSGQLRLLVGMVLAIGLAVAAFLPNGHACSDGELFRQWSYTQERWFYGCRPSAEEIERHQGSFFPYYPMDAAVDRRIPLRIGLGLVALSLAWGLAARELRHPSDSTASRAVAS
jgi:hypothetical protein